MKERTSKKLKGRFFKNDDRTIQSMKINNFNLSEICETPIAFPDNPNSNVFFKKYHHPSDLAIGIRKSREINTIFKRENARPVIQPLDFTAEWERQKKRMNNRSSKNEEDEEIDLEMESITRRLREEVTETIADLKSVSKTSDTEAETQTSDDQMDDMEINDLIAAEVDSQAAETSDHLAPKTDEPKPREETPTQPVFHFKADQDLDTSDQNSDPEPMTNHTQSANESEAFIPMQETQIPNFKQTGDDSGELVSSPSLSEQEAEELRQAARADGFQQGYAEGEQKALLSARSQIEGIMSEFDKLSEEFSGLKNNILHNAQENFQIICQAMIESLLSESFKINPQGFEKIIGRAIDEAVPDDEFKVKISPDAYQLLSRVVSDDFKRKLLSDETISGFNFKIESKLTVVDGQLQQIISDLLQQADTSIFEDTEKVS